MASRNKHLCSLFSLFLILLLSERWGLQLVEGRVPHHQLNFLSKKLFVFGDSYADTGNSRKAQSRAWKHPYGISFPGKPTGRFSDGKVLTDYIGQYVKVKSPVPYALMKEMPHHVKYGINFAFGGTGVFDTSVEGPNMTTQIDTLEGLLNDKVYTKSELANSVALVSVAGNDYDYYLATNGSVEGVLSLINSVVNQTATNMRRIHELGVKKIALTSLPPLGCLPQLTASSSFQTCNDTYNKLVSVHNRHLLDALATLNGESKKNVSFVMLNLYDSFMSILNGPKEQSHKIQHTFKPCCMGVSNEYSCGSIDENQIKKYSVCDDRKSSFFWDAAHPTHAGWHGVYNILRTTTDLQQLQY